MTRVFLTIDTEYSSGLLSDKGEAGRRDNFARSIQGATASGPAGVPFKLDVFERYGIKAVFFVDPMPALLWGVAAIEDIVGPILQAGHDVQLHCHTEWLALAPERGKIASGRTGANLFDFTLEDQLEILDYAQTTLIAAGAPRPIAFRAGNYGADDNTLKALVQLGLRYDTSHCPALPQASRISLSPANREPIEHHAITEVPVGSIGTIQGGQRHAQITALSLAEMRAAIAHARALGQDSLTYVTHSFELINRRTQTTNRIVRRRFEGLCQTISAMQGVSSGTYRDTPPIIAHNGQTDIAPAASPSPAVLPASVWRTGYRLAEQALSNTLYGAL